MYLSQEPCPRRAPCALTITKSAPHTLQHRIELNRGAKGDNQSIISHVKVAVVFCVFALLVLSHAKFLGLLLLLSVCCERHPSGVSHPRPASAEHGGERFGCEADRGRPPQLHPGRRQRAPRAQQRAGVFGRRQAGERPKGRRGGALDGGSRHNRPRASYQVYCRSTSDSRGVSERLVCYIYTRSNVSFL